MTVRHFGIPIGGTASLGGVSTDGPSRGSYAPLPEFPAGSILPARAPLELSDASDPMLNSFAVIVRALLGTVTGLGLAFGLFVLFFVKV
jgi:hypothetical protein